MAHTYGTSARLPATATTTNANPATVSLTCGAGTTVLWLGIVVSGTTQRSGGAPTYNGLTMTQAGSKRNAGGTAEEYVEQWYLLDPPTGSSYTISVPNSNSTNLTFSAATGLAGSGKYSELDNQSGASGSSTNPAASITCNKAGDIVFAVCGDGANTWAPSARSGTQIHDWDAGSRGHGTQYVLVAGTGSQATNWTFGTSEDWAISNAAFKVMSGSRQSAPQYGKASLQTPTIITGHGKDVSVGLLNAKAIQHTPVTGYDVAIAQVLMQAVAEFFGTLMSTGVGVDLSEHIPIYGKAQQFAPTIDNELKPAIPQGLQESKAVLHEPTIAADFNIHPEIEVGLLGAVTVQYGEHTDTANGITMEEHLPLYAKGQMFAPTISTVVNLEKVNVTIGADSLAIVTEQFGSHSATEITTILEQRNPMGAKANWLQHDIQVNTEYSQPVILGIDHVLNGVAQQFGNHTSSDLIMSPESPHEVAAVQFDPSISGTINPIDDVTVLPTKQTARVVQFTPSVKTDSIVSPDMLSAVSEQQTPVMHFRVNVTPEADHLEAAIEQFDGTVAEQGSPVILVGCLSASVVQYTATPRYEKVVAVSLLEAIGIEEIPGSSMAACIVADCTAAVAEQATPTISPIKNPVVTLNTMTAIGKQKAPVVVTVYAGAIHPDCLIATGGMLTPAIIQVHIIGLMRMLLAESAPRVDIEGARPYVVVKGEVE